MSGELPDSVIVKSTIRPENPGINRIDQALGKLYYGLQIVTRPRRQPGVEPVVPTSLPTRADRVRELKVAKALRKNTAPGDAQRNDHLAFVIQENQVEREFHDQKALTIHHPKWGDLTACYSVLNTGVSSDQNPILIISGASNGVESMDSFVRKLALRQPHRKIFVLGYPDAPSGVMSEEFYNEVKSAQGFEPHAEFFQSEINHLLPEGDFELWGYSAGGAIASEILKNKQFSDRVSNAVLLCPHGSTGQTKQEFSKGLANDSGKLLQWLKNIANYVFIDDPTRGNQKTWKFNTWTTLGEKGCNPVFQNNLANIHLREDAKAVIISGGDDQITKSSKTFNSTSVDQWRTTLPSLEIDVIPGALHTGPFLQPDVFITSVLHKLGRKE